ncbi:MAG TPA: branched-chain amino acid ABC transporter ATP-binding protein [Clostridiales bacterium]|nr:branched-chain amino acid ABC transporter ATP-binding protein [Clostridiales bacterium]
MILLEIKDVEIYYGQMKVIKEVSISVHEGELVTVIGANGAGKTTLIKAIMGLKEIKSGSIIFKEKDITNDPAWKRAEMGIGYIPEGRRVFNNLTVEENLKMGCYKIKDKDTIKKNINKAYELFPILDERKNQLANTMSGGEQQMLAIGRALVLEPRLLLIDEISMGLMPILVNTSFRIIKELNDAGITVLIVEQNANKVLKIADRGYVLETGNIVMENTAKNLMENDTVKKAYLGS